jgi:hypothetical protein
LSDERHLLEPIRVILQPAGGKPLPLTHSTQGYMRLKRRAFWRKSYRLGATFDAVLE